MSEKLIYNSIYKSIINQTSINTLTSVLHVRMGLNVQDESTFITETQRTKSEVI